MGQATKGGMYCERCDQPVAAQKTTHGVRNTAGIFTMFLTTKIEDWHCPSCGGPVKTVRGAEAAKRREEKQQPRRTGEPVLTQGAQDAAAERHSWSDEIAEGGSSVLVLTALPDPSKPPSKGANKKAYKEISQFFQVAMKDRGTAYELRSGLEDLPCRFEDLDEIHAKSLLIRMRRLGCTVEVENRAL
jgi:hypothetical protein